jgi:hypothetical protein
MVLQVVDQSCPKAITPGRIPQGISRPRHGGCCPRSGARGGHPGQACKPVTLLNGPLGLDRLGTLWHRNAHPLGCLWPWCRDVPDLMREVAVYLGLLHRAPHGVAARWYRGPHRDGGILRLGADEGLGHRATRTGLNGHALGIHVSPKERLPGDRGRDLRSSRLYP